MNKNKFRQNKELIKALYRVINNGLNKAELIRKIQNGN